VFDGDLDIFVPIPDTTSPGYLFGGESQPGTCLPCNEAIPFTALINDGTGFFLVFKEVQIG
jgi:hypothetical protein